MKINASILEVEQNIEHMLKIASCTRLDLMQLLAAKFEIEYIIEKEEQNASSKFPCMKE